MRSTRFGAALCQLALALGTVCFSEVSIAMDGDEYSLRQAIGQANQAIQGEVLKGAASQKAVLEGLATYRAQNRLQDKAITLQRDLKQSEQMCQQMDSADTLAGGGTKIRAAVAQSQRKAVMPMTRNINTLAAVDSMHRATNDSFCSEEEVALGVCRPTTNSKYANLAGADQNAMYLFQSRSGGDTYEGSKDSGQVDAVNAYIARVVSGGVPPEHLRVAGSDTYAKNPQARAYVELARRYEAYLSMAAFSLNSIKGSRTPAK